eukprot:3154243-Alexandrium_andersonii.AAC.1
MRCAGPERGPLQSGLGACGAARTHAPCVQPCPPPFLWHASALGVWGESRVVWERECATHSVRDLGPAVGQDDRTSRGAVCWASSPSLGDRVQETPLPSEGLGAVTYRLKP